MKFPGRGDQDQPLDPVGMFDGILRAPGAAEGMPHQDEFALDLQQDQGGFDILHGLGHAVSAGRRIGESMPAHIQGNDAVIEGEILQLVMPLLGLSPKAVQENKRPPGLIGRNIDRRKPYQRIGRNTDLLAVEVEVYLHIGSLHEGRMAVNQKNISCRHSQTWISGNNKTCTRADLVQARGPLPEENNWEW